MLLRKESESYSIYTIDYYFKKAVFKLDVVELEKLIEQYPDYDCSRIAPEHNKFRYSLLMHAIETRAYFSADDGSGRRPHDAKKEMQRRLSIIKKLLKHKADVNYADNVGMSNHRSPLMFAVWRGYTEVVEVLLEHKADVNYFDRDGESALTIAIRYKYENIVKILIAHGANINYCQAPFIVAAAESKSEIGKILKEKLVEQHKGKIIQIKGKLYKEIKPLKGRGQSAAAGFYQRMDTEDQNLYLIKEDASQISVLEGSVDWAMKLLPATNVRRVINPAQCVSLEVPLYPDSKKEESKEIKMGTIQLGIKNAHAWDSIIFGGRTPKSPVSSEWLHSDEIKKHIEGLNDQVKSDLALALFLSSALGDESQHTGQFMCFMDEMKTITGLVRIDFGARERHGLARLEANDFKHQTSKVYARSGQCGKDYISFLLADPTVYLKYMYLWARLKDKAIENAVKGNIDSFREQMLKIPEVQKTETLNAIYDIYVKGSSKKRTGNIIQSELEEMMSTIVMKRLTLMRLSARQFILDPIIRLEKDQDSDLEDKDEDTILENKQTSNNYYSAVNVYVLWEILINVKEQFDLLDKELDKDKESKMINKRISDCDQYLAYLNVRIQFDGINPKGNKIGIEEALSHVNSFQTRIKMIKELIKYPYHPDIIHETIRQLIKNKDLNEVIKKLKKDIPVKKEWGLYQSKKYLKSKTLIEHLEIELEKSPVQILLEQQIPIQSKLTKH